MNYHLKFVNIPPLLSDLPPLHGLLKLLNCRQFLLLIKINLAHFLIRTHFYYETIISPVVLL